MIRHIVLVSTLFASAYSGAAPAVPGRGWTTTTKPPPGWSSTTQGWSTTPPPSQGWSTTTQGWSTTPPPTTQGWSTTAPPTTQGWSTTPPPTTQGWSTAPPTTQGWSTTSPPTTQGWSTSPPTTQGWSTTPPPSQGWSSTTPGWGHGKLGWSTTSGWSTTQGWSSPPGWSTTTQGWNSPPGWSSTTQGWSNPGWSTTQGWGSQPSGWGSPSIADLAASLAATGSGWAAENHAEDVQVLGGGWDGPPAELLVSSGGDSIVEQNGNISQLTQLDPLGAAALNLAGVSQLVSAAESAGILSAGSQIAFGQSGWVASEGQGASGSDAQLNLQAKSKPAPK